MKSTAAWENEGRELVSAEFPNEDNELTPARNKITNLKELTLRLFREVQALTEVPTLSFESGLDFYDEVSRFEMELINRALFQTRGHQGRAARLLNLKVTTLNSKIKHYNIRLEGFATVYPLIESSEIETPQHA
jgi:DNA-binding NtrC family response regulator